MNAPLLNETVQSLRPRHADRTRLKAIAKTRATLNSHRSTLTADRPWAQSMLSPMNCMGSKALMLSITCMPS